MVYGQLTREYIKEQEEYQAIQEMFFSKKDLQDPETIKKIDNVLKKKGIFKKLSFFLAFLETALYLGITVITKGLALIGIFPFAGLLLATSEAVESIPAKSYEKNMKKFKTKVLELKQKSEEKLKSDPKNASKYREIIANCDKVLAVFKRREDEIKQKIKMGQLNSAKEYYELTIKWLNDPWDFGEDTNELCIIFYICEFLEINEGIIIQKLDQLAKESGDTFEELSLNSGDFDELKSLYTKIPEYNAKKDILLLAYYADEGYEIWYSPMSKSLYELDPFGKRINKFTPYSFDRIFKNYENYLEFNDSDLEEVDKELGYYKISPCPPQVEKKPFPV